MDLDPDETNVTSFQIGRPQLRSALSYGACPLLREDVKMSPIVQNSPPEDRHLVAWRAHGAPKPPTNLQGVVGVITDTASCKRQPLVQMLLEQFSTPNVSSPSRTKSFVKCR